MPDSWNASTHRKNATKRRIDIPLWCHVSVWSTKTAAPPSSTTVYSVPILQVWRVKTEHLTVTLCYCEKRFSYSMYRSHAKLSLQFTYKRGGVDPQLNFLWLTHKSAVMQQWVQGSITPFGTVIPLLMGWVTSLLSFFGSVITNKLNQTIKWSPPLFNLHLLRNLLTFSDCSAVLWITNHELPSTKCTQPVHF